MPYPLSPAQHYLDAEKDIQEAYVVDAEMASFFLARAQVHALLASVSSETYSRAREIVNVFRSDQLKEN